jgi:hypothetical protein
MTYNYNRNEETATLTGSVRLTLQTEEGDEVSVKKDWERSKKGGKREEEKMGGVYARVMYVCEKGKKLRHART